MKLGEVRSIVPQGTPMMALTATAPISLRRELAQILGMRSPASVILSPCKGKLWETFFPFKTISQLCYPTLK